VVSPFPPTHKIGMYSMDGYNKVVEMKRLGMHWDPYIQIKNRSHFHTGSSSWKHEPQIFVLSCADRKTSLESVKHFNRRLLLEDCVPYFDNPLKKQTCVDIRYPSEPEPVICKFDLEMDDLEEFTYKLIEAKELSKHHKDGFKEYVSIKLQEIQRANDEVSLQLSRGEVAAAFKNTRFYKFYPVPTSETPVTHQWKMSRTIKGYYGGAHGIF
ncbi:heat intolerant 4-like protein, partial [Tanacetum coccineum]